MPKSRRRKAKPATPRKTMTRIELVDQRNMAMLVDDLDDIMRAVPDTYDDQNLSEVVEHHYRLKVLHDFLRDRDVAGVLARLAGGEMIVVPSGAGTPSREADNSQDGDDTASAPPAPLTIEAGPANGPMVPLVDADAPFSPVQTIDADAPDTSWGSLMGQVISVPGGTPNARTKALKPFESRFSMRVLQVIPWADGSATVVGPMVTQDGRETTTKRALISRRRTEGLAA